MDIYSTPSRFGSNLPEQQMIRYQTARSQRSPSSSPPSSYYGSPNSSTSSFRAVERAYTEVSTTSVQTMGSPNRPGYVPGQAPATYFYDERAKMQWDALIQSRRVSNPSEAPRGFYGAERQLRSDWCEDGERSITPEDSISNVGSTRSYDARPERRYYEPAAASYEGSRASRSCAPSGTTRSGYSSARTQVANGRRVVEVLPV